MNTIQRLEQLIRKIKSDDSIAIKKEDSLKKDLSFSSLETLQFIDKIQAEFEFEFEIEDYNDKNFVDIQSIIELVELRKKVDNAVS
jgi:acyl carrier protein